jgi:hypothetical protein
VDSAIEALDFETEPARSLLSARLERTGSPGTFAGCSAAEDPA